MATDKITSAGLTEDIITGQPAASNIADDDLILISDTGESAALKKMTRANFVSGIGGANTPAFFANVSPSDQEVNNNTFTKIQFATEVFDTDGTYDHSTNYRWTPGATGKYIIGLGCWFYDAGDNIQSLVISIYKNGSADSYFQTQIVGSDNRFQRFQMTAVHPIDVTSTSDYYEAYVRVNTADSNSASFNASTNLRNYFYGYKLIT